jgi:hypothetical protein
MTSRILAFNPEQAGPTNPPGLISFFFFVSPIPLFLNVVCIIAFFKFPNLRKAPSDILTVMAAIYALRDFFFLTVAIFGLFADPSDTDFNAFACNYVAFLNYVITYLVYSYSIALNMFIANVAKSNKLYTEDSTRTYHLFAIGTTVLFTLMVFFIGTEG